MVVFLPIALMDGMSGQLFKEVGFTIVYSLTASLISALTIVPLLFVQFRPREKERSWVNTQLHRLERVYARVLEQALSHKLVVIVIAVVLLAGTAVMFSRLDMELMPMSDEGSISILGLLPHQGNKLARLDRPVVLEGDSQTGGAATAAHRITFHIRLCCHDRSRCGAGRCDRYHPVSGCLDRSEYAFGHSGRERENRIDSNCIAMATNTRKTAVASAL